MTEKTSNRIKIDFEAWPEIKHMAEQLKRGREKVGMTQGQVAEEIGTAQTYIAAVENGFGNPSAQLLAQLARLYKIAPGSLFPKTIVKMSPHIVKRNIKEVSAKPHKE